MILTRACRFLIAALVLGTLTLAPVRATAEGVLVFAAASLKTALDEIVPAFEDRTGHQVTVSYAASSVLARQIQQGAPADLFISANQDWMDQLQDMGLIAPDSRIDLLGNGLVLIGPSRKAPAQDLSADFDLMTALDGGYLATALVDAVPAGVYAKAALQSLGLWDDVQEQVAQSDNVRAALALVASGAAPLGIVYRSDAQAEARVSVVAAIPGDLHPPIVYPAALTATANPAGRAFLEHLQSTPSQGVFAAQGFSLPNG